jgi:hypothetical protein
MQSTSLYLSRSLSLSLSLHTYIHIEIEIDLENGSLDERHEKNKGCATVAHGEEACGRRRERTGIPEMTGRGDKTGRVEWRGREDKTGRLEWPAWSDPVNPKLVCANMNLLVS